MTRQPTKPAVTAILIIACAFSAALAQVTITVNNVGYERTGVKRAVVQSASAIAATEATLVNAQGNTVRTIALGPQVTVASWSGPNFRNFKVADFSACSANGDGYRVRVGTTSSPAFSIGEKILQVKTGADQVGFFNKMRNTDAEDRNLPIFGSSRTHNIYGGWWDATGDPGKHLSHLSYANYYSPQQIPMVVWALLHANELQPDAFGASARAEAAWGADYLLRSLSSEGYFYMSVFDNWGDGYRWTEQPSGSKGQREICAWGNMAGIEDGNSKGIRSADYQSAMREGGGVSIAALAKAYKAGISGDSSAARYLAGAVRAYQHLKANPTKYQDDGKENIIDDYCGLLAATELYHATDEEQYRVDAKARAESLLKRQSPGGWFYSGTDNSGKNIRPFHHAADEGLPVVALSRYYWIAADKAEKPDLREAVRKNLLHYANITYNHGSNPFEYAKMYRAGGESGGNGGVTGVDLARGKTGTASRTEGGYTVANAFDGTTTTRWSSYQNGAQNDSQWIAVDLGKAYKVNKVILNWEAAFGKHYRIDVSPNGTSWTRAFEITNNTNAGRVEHTFTPVDARHVRMFGITRGLEYGGFSLYQFEVYGEEIQDGTTPPPSEYQAHYFIPKVNETGYWWQGENARLASMASAFILGAPLADPTGAMWADTLFGMATAQLDWILGRNPLVVCMMFGYEKEGVASYENYPATRALPNIKGGICNGISSARTNENNIEFCPYKNEGPDQEFWRNWRYIEQWLPHNAWYLTAIASLSYRMDNKIEPEEDDDTISVKHGIKAKFARLSISALRGGNVRVELPLGADLRTEVAIYDMRGKKLFTHAMQPGSRAASIKLPARIARGAYLIGVMDMAGKNIAAGKIYLR